MAETFDPYHKWLGIPPSEQPPNHYRLLGVSLFEPDADVVANAADQRMSHVRTFQAGRHSDLSQKILNEIAGARVCLLNPARRAEYDRQLHEQLATQTDRPDAAAASAAVPPLLAMAPPPLPWSDDSPSTYRARPTKAAWRGKVILAGVMAGCVVGLWLAWTYSGSEESARPAPGNRLAGPTTTPGTLEGPAPPDSTSGGTAVEPPAPAKPQAKELERPSPKPQGPSKPAPDSATATPSPKTEQPTPKPTPSPPDKAASPTAGAAPGSAAMPVAGGQKAPAPDAAAQKEAEARLGAVLSGGSTATLREAAKDASRDPDQRFVLLRKAADLAVAAGDAAAAMESIDQQAGQFDIDAPGAKLKALAAMRSTASSPDVFRAVTEQLLALLNAPADSLRGDKLRQAAEMALAASRKCGDAELMKRATLRYIQLSATGTP